MDVVAVFPPFDHPRPKDLAEAFDDFAAIFREPPCTRPGDLLDPEEAAFFQNNGRKKRQAEFCPNRNVLEKFFLNIQCYRPRLEELLGKRSHSKKFNLIARH